MQELRIAGSAPALPVLSNANISSQTHKGKKKSTHKSLKRKQGRQVDIVRGK